ncbi:MAG: sigma factor [Pirellulaceae bacterium]
MTILHVQIIGRSAESSLQPTYSPLSNTEQIPMRRCQFNATAAIGAFAEIIRVCQRPVRAWTASRCPPGGDADDVAQQTFVAAFKRIDEYEVGTDFRAWLFTIARYQLMAECTRLKRSADYHSR